MKKHEQKNIYLIKEEFDLNLSFFAEKQLSAINLALQTINHLDMFTHHAYVLRFLCIVTPAIEFSLWKLKLESNHL